MRQRKKHTHLPLVFLREDDSLSCTYSQWRLGCLYLWHEVWAAHYQCSPPPLPLCLRALQRIKRSTLPGCCIIENGILIWLLLQTRSSPARSLWSGLKKESSSLLGCSWDWISRPVSAQCNQRWDVKMLQAQEEKWISERFLHEWLFWTAEQMLSVGRNHSSSIMSGGWQNFDFLDS